MHKLAVAAAVVALSLVLGATIFNDQVAWAATIMDVRITNLDAGGNVKVHEQGTATVTGNVNAKVSGNVTARIEGGVVGSAPVAPPWPFSESTFVDRTFTAVGLAGPVSGPINLTSLIATAAAPVPASSASKVEIWAADVAGAATSCDPTQPTTDARIVAHFWLYAVQPELAMPFPTPLVATPSDGMQECLYVATTRSDFRVELTAVGFYG